MQQPSKNIYRQTLTRDMSIVHISISCLSKIIFIFKWQKNKKSYFLNGSAIKRGGGDSRFNLLLIISKIHNISEDII